jgi:uncharacterized protein with NRDE domain
MCLLLAALDVVAGHPLVVLANRDEYWDRPAEGPAPRGGDPAVVCGLDRRAGGTWLGMNASGVVAVLTNRPGPLDPGRPSRGAVAMHALTAHSSDAAAAKAAARAVRDQPNPFSLFVGDEHGGVAVTWDGPESEPRIVALAPGLHTLSNLHDLDALEVARVLQAAPDGPVALPDGLPLDDAVAQLQRLAPSHAPLDGTRTAVCVHDAAQRRGTVSSAVLAVAADGSPARFVAADGPPCRTPWRAVALPA